MPKSALFLSGCVIVLLALLLRFPGVFSGYPLVLHPDEPTLVDAARAMVLSGDLNPHFFRYPSLIMMMI